MKAAEYRTAELAAMSEKDWQHQVITFAQHRGWLVYWTWNSVHSPAGYPDLTMVRAMPNGDRRVVFAELKKVGKDPTENQRQWLAALELVSELCEGRIEVHLWRPTDWNEVKERLM